MNLTEVLEEDPPPPSEVCQISEPPIGRAPRGVPVWVRWLSLLVAVAGPIVVLSRHHLLGHTTFPWDFIGKESTSPAFVAALFEARMWSDWVPFQDGGSSLAADPLGGLYFPLWWVLGLAGVAVTLKVATVVQVAAVLAAGFGATALARSHSLPWRWSAYCGLAYGLFGAFYGGASHATIVRGLALLPWMLWALSVTDPRYRPRRTLVLPLLAWLLVAGAYPGHYASFAVTGGLYLVVGLVMMDPSSRRRLLGPLVACCVAGAAIVAVVLLPYAVATSAGDLFRPFPPEEFHFRLGSLDLIGVMGLYLNNFAWGTATIHAWSIGLPVLVGLAGLRLVDIVERRLRPLWILGAASLLLITVGNIRPVAQAMAALSWLFPSRMHFADYKGQVAIVLILVSAIGWRRLLTTRDRVLVPTAVMTGFLVVAGIVVARQEHSAALFDVRATSHIGLLVVVGVGCVAVVALRRNARLGILVAVMLVVGLLGLDGYRRVRDLTIDENTDPFAFELATAERVERDAAAQRLVEQLEHPPAARPARTPTVQDRETRPHGFPQDAYGFLGLGYRAGNFGGTITSARWEIWGDPLLYETLLAPWGAVALPCNGCDEEAARRLVESAAPFAVPRFDAAGPVRMTRYAVDDIAYDVATDTDLVIVENEIAAEGWSSGDERFHDIETSLPFRVSMVEAGSYDVALRYRDPARGLQVLAGAVAVIGWIAGAALVVRSERERRDAGARDARSLPGDTGDAEQRGPEAEPPPPQDRPFELVDHGGGAADEP
jgi:hypothetical protein